MSSSWSRINEEEITPINEKVSFDTETLGSFAIREHIYPDSLYDNGTENVTITGGHHKATTCNYPGYWNYNDAEEKTDHLEFNSNTNRKLVTWVTNNSFNTHNIEAVKITYTASGRSHSIGFYTITNNSDSSYCGYSLPDASEKTTITIPMEDFSISEEKTWQENLWFSLSTAADVYQMSYMKVWYIEIIYK